MTPEAIQACRYALEVNGDHVAIEIPAAEYRRLLDRAAEANRLERELAKWQQAVNQVEQDLPRSESEGEFPGYREGWLDAIHNIYRNAKQGAPA